MQRLSCDRRDLSVPRAVHSDLPAPPIASIGYRTPSGSRRCVSHRDQVLDRFFARSRRATDQPSSDPPKRGDFGRCYT